MCCVFYLVVRQKLRFTGFSTAKIIIGFLNFWAIVSSSKFPYGKPYYFHIRVQYGHYPMYIVYGIGNNVRSETKFLTCNMQLWKTIIFEPWGVTANETPILTACILFFYMAPACVLVNFVVELKRSSSSQEKSSGGHYSYILRMIEENFCFTLVDYYCACFMILTIYCVWLIPT